MINRGITKTSQYFFNSETGMLEKVDNNIQTIESLSKQVGTNLDDIAKEVNKSDDNAPINNITVITSDDNLIHNYFTDMDVSWDASNCLSTAIIKMPKMGTENTNYWATYYGQLTIYAGHDFTFDYVNSNSHPTEKDAAQSLVKYWDNSNILPFFKGEISRMKEFENDIVIYVDSIGRRFQQKIPDDFRQSYIYNQNVRDAFQAICEFLGVVYICPPKIMTDNGITETEGTEEVTDGTENDINDQINIEKRITLQAKEKIKQNKNSIEKNNQSQNSSIDKSNSKLATESGVEGLQSQNNEIDKNLTNNQEIDEGPQNGYGDINFDANGAIIHGSTVIETSPDMAETLIAMDESPLEKYLDDETGIVEKVQKFLKGEMFDETHNAAMNYDAITIDPKSASSSEMSGVSGAPSGGTSSSAGDTTGSGTSSSAGGNLGSSSGANTSSYNQSGIASALMSGQSSIVARSQGKKRTIPYTEKVPVTVYKNGKKYIYYKNVTKYKYV